MEPSAKVIADSISLTGHRVTTIEAVMHRFVLAEFNTHRVFSRNSASSRAIPLTKQLAKVQTDCAFPVSWPTEQKGMQGGEELVEYPREQAGEIWENASEDAINSARALGQLGVHKSVANRLLEPFMWHTVIVTSTAWENFFGLRCNPMAQPEIRATADAMKAAYEASQPRTVTMGNWHLPYVQDDEYHEHETSTLVMLSSARCARVSYLTQAGERDIAEDINLYTRLTSATPMHASPLEHVATPYNSNLQEVVVISRPNGNLKPLILPRYGNLLGWHQHRFDVEIDRDYQAFA